MSRFAGWTSAAVEKLLKRGDCVNSGDGRQVNDKQSSPDHVGKISGALRVLGIEHEREYKFLHDRIFRFDIAIPTHRIAIEFEGGIYSKGRHTRGKGYARDAKKYNLATMHGWRLLRFTTADLQELNWEYRAAQEIKDLSEGVK